MDEPYVTGGVPPDRIISMKCARLFTILLCFCCLSQAAGAAGDQTRYLAFQIFTGTRDSAELIKSFPPPPNVDDAVNDIHDRIGITGGVNRKLGFILGPLAFDNTDDDVRREIAHGFDLALQNNMAVGFHIDDSMFWGRLKNLGLPGGIEWRDWAGTPNSGRQLDWSSKPLHVMPQLCLNSKLVQDAVRARAGIIAEEIAKGLQRLHTQKKDDLFIGVIAGWETQIGRDVDTGEKLGYCALTNAGFTEKHPPADFDQAREKIVADFIALWSRALNKGGVPADKIYSHTAFRSKVSYELQRHLAPTLVPDDYPGAVNATPPDVSFGTMHRAGFTTYPELGHLEQITDELNSRGNPPWASAEGSAIAPQQAEKHAPGGSMESYLASLFDRGAVFVNVFGWGVGASYNPYRQAAQGEDAIAAYRKFLKGEKLTAAALPQAEIPSDNWHGKMDKLQQALPGYIAHHGTGKVRDLLSQLEAQTAAYQFIAAEKTADQLLAIIGK